METPSPLSAQTTPGEAAKDVENPPQSTPPPLPSNGPPARFPNARLAAAASYLYDASITGKLGSGPAEPDIINSTARSIVRQTVPWRLLLIQLLWSGGVLALAYALREKNPDGSNKHVYLSEAFWTSRLNVSPSIAYGVGWALFVLLGFFVREASARYKEAQFTLEDSMSNARQLLRHTRQVFAPGYWHAGDVDRIAAHLVALPIALKMTLRGERDKVQLERILHPDDVADVLASDLMFVQCLRVIRAYISAAEDDSPFSFRHCATEKTPSCVSGRRIMQFMVDRMDGAAGVAVRIAQSRPSAGYLNHLRIFLYIWMFFLPLVLVKTSGFFTVLWSLIITYCVGMLFTIAEALNKPFGYDFQDVKLNRICAAWGYELLLEHSMSQFNLKEIVRHDHDTPAWLEQPCTDRVGKDVGRRGKRKRAYHRFRRNLFTSFVLKHLLMFIVWLTFIVVLVWRITLDRPRMKEDRWWTIYLPLSSDTTGFISLGVFLLLGFWLNDAYGQFWECIQIWNTKVKPGLEGAAFLLSVIQKKGSWHERDHQRLLSFFVAYLYSVKLDLRQSRDVSELNDVLDARDLQALAQAPNLPSHCMNVILGYMNVSEALDSEVFKSGENAWGWSRFNLMFKLWNVQNAVSVCDATRKYPASPALTVHLFLYIMFWFILLPISLVKENGFFTFPYIIPVAYSIINLLSIGVNLSDPFGYDHEDIPMDSICEEFRSEIHSTFHDVQDGIDGFVREEAYDRTNFEPGVLRLKNTSSAVVESSELAMLSTSKSHDVLTIQKVFMSFVGQLPTVSLLTQAIATVWSIIAVFVSWRLSKLDESWHNGTRGDCKEWCSPIDVDGDTLANVGYALFMLLSFRASDAVGRYESGAQLIYDLKLQLHSNVVDFMFVCRQDYVHPKDRERILAHIVQIPLLIRDRLLQGTSFNPVSAESLLSENDKCRLASSRNPFEYLLRTVQSYSIVLDGPNHGRFTREPMTIIPASTNAMIEQCMEIRDVFSKMLSVKSFPVIPRYANHQYIFTGLWLGLLPLYMTRQTGFFTILWAPLISYGVFALESIAEKLVDPFGNDAIDIPVQRLLTETAEELLNTVEALDWDSYRLTRPSPVDVRPSVGTVLNGKGVTPKRQFAYFEKHEATVENFGKSPIVQFQSAASMKPKPNLLAHFVHSVPWWSLLLIISWTAVGCVISYVTRNKTVTTERWWKSGLSVGTNIATYVSFATFTLLAFYVQAAFRRYNCAGTVWGDNLRASCHTFAALMLNYVEEGVIHDRDQDRILGYIAAIPLVLKLELLKSGDLRQLNGLLSAEDIGRLQSADSMTVHCVDVLRAYIHEVAHHPERLAKQPGPVGNRLIALNKEVTNLQTALRSARFLNEFQVAPGFIALRNSLLGIWFLFLPFVLAEISGWFTILWVAIIAYGVLGMYAVASELQAPFGTDLNDLDLDKIADFIVRDVLFVQKNYKAGLETFTRPSEPVALWDSDSSFEVKPTSLLERHEPFGQRAKTGVKLAARSLSPQLLFEIVWSALCVLLAYGTSKWFEVTPCDSKWFCTYIAVDDSLKGFIGFSLFLLLGFRMYDSHARYDMAVHLWQDNILGLCHLMTTRFLTAFPPNTFHSGDLERVCGHIAAFAICSMGALRGKDYEDRLGRVVSAADAQRILSARDRADYCMDVVRAYVLQEDHRARLGDGSGPAGGNERFMLKAAVGSVSQSAHECLRLVRIPLPFGYVQHLRVFLHIWLLLLPLSLVESNGWISTLWVVFIAYGVLSVEHWSQELADPFGYDISDVPLEELCDSVVADIKLSLGTIRGKGVGVWIKAERDGFCAGG